MEFNADDNHNLNTGYIIHISIKMKRWVFQ